jgi:cell division protein FtsW
MNTKANRPDRLLVIITLLLVAVGIVMVYSSSVAVAQQRHHASSFFLKRHILRALLGLLALLVVVRIDYHRWESLAGLGMFFSLLLLGLVLLPRIGLNGQESASEVSRHISLPILRFQPSELIKLVMVFYLARQLTRKEMLIDDFKKGLLPSVCVIGTSLILIVLEPDLGTAIVIGLLAMTIFIVAGVRWLHLLALGTVGLAGVVAFVVSAPYRLRRVLTFLDPTWDPSGAGYHIRQSLISLGSGGIFGVGLGNSRQKLLFLPEPHTDFVFSIVGEELGFLGVLIILSLFLLLAWRGLRAARQSGDRFGYLLGVGITASIFLNMAVNVAVVASLCPTTGLPLPFISYGGSSLLMNLIGMGVLINISRNGSRKKPPWAKRRASCGY